MSDAICKPFAEQSPICVMAVVAVRRLLGKDRLDRPFDRARAGQYVYRLMFADLFYLMAAVVSGTRKSIHHAYQSSGIAVSAVAVYDKLKGVEPSVCQALVRETAAEVAAVMAEMAAAPAAAQRPPALAGYHTKVLDGNCCAATEHRLKPLRQTSAGPLPCKGLVVLDVDRRVICDLFPCPDGHAQERAILPKVYPTVAAGNPWVADRNFCTAEFLVELPARGACFVVRRHGNTAVRPTGDRVRVGACDTGVAYEQPVVITALGGCGGAAELPLRMVNRRAGPRHARRRRHADAADQPAGVGRRRRDDGRAVPWPVADRDRIQELATHCDSEIAMLGYPGAALFAFAVAVTLYNAVALMRAALAAHHGATPVDEDVSGYYVAAELATTTRGMLIAIAPHHWDPFETMPPTAFAAEMVALAGAVNPSHFRKYPRGPDRPQPPKVHDRASPHVSTHRLLDEAKAKRKQATRH